MVKTEEGEVALRVSKVGQAMGRFWQKTMTSPGKTAQECEQFIEQQRPPKVWKEAMEKLWLRPSEEVVLTALEALDPTSAPGEDGIPALLYQVFEGYFMPRILWKMNNIARTGSWGDSWARGLMRTIPKEVGNLAVDKQRPITLLNTKAKWVTGTIRLCITDFLMIMVPVEQKGFMPGSVDGSGVDGKQYTGYWVWFGEGHILNGAYKLPGLRQTNNRAEMMATLHAMKIVPKWAPLHICTDSQLVVDTVVYWMAGWEIRGWKTKTGKSVENADLWQAIK